MILLQTLIALRKHWSFYAQIMMFVLALIEIAFDNDPSDL